MWEPCPRDTRWGMTQGRETMLPSLVHGTSQKDTGAVQASGEGHWENGPIHPSEPNGSERFYIRLNYSFTQQKNIGRFLTVLLLFSAPQNSWRPALSTDFKIQKVEPHQMEMGALVTHKLPSGFHWPEWFVWFHSSAVVPL